MTEESKEANLRLSRKKTAKLVKCPAKSNKAVKNLALAGEDWHGNDNHYCEKCACQNAAGLKTDHLGYGWCSSHEKNVGDTVAENFAKKHMDALQQHKPFIYRNPDKWLKDVQESGMRSQKKIDLFAEIEIARSLISEIVEKAKSGSFTETYKNGPGPASDATRAKSLKGLLDSMGKLSVSKIKIDESDTFTKDELRVMMSQLGTIAQECILDKVEDRQKAWEKFVRMIKEVKGLNPHG